ncbi:MAG: DUF6884 domain-containing protein, partial [Desulfovibrionaceae bacterium]
MERYQGLLSWLRRQSKDEITLALSEIEGINQRALPQSAHRHQAFWSVGHHLGRELSMIGWKASPKLSSGFVRFVRQSMQEPPSVPAGREEALPEGFSKNPPDIVLIGCVKTKRPGRHPARNLYRSPLFRERRAVAEASGRPWFILSAKYGLLEPEAAVDSYELCLAALTAKERREWSEGVLRDLERLAGSLKGKIVEVHAGRAYLGNGLEAGLLRRGATVRHPVKGLSMGKQREWYKRNRTGEPVSVNTDAKTVLRSDLAEIVRDLTRDFYEDSFNLRERPKAPRTGWEAMPEVVAVRRLETQGATPLFRRLFITLAAALDRARNAGQLWEAAADLAEASPWAFDPSTIASRPFEVVMACLRQAKVSQRHGRDSQAWNRIAEALLPGNGPQEIRRLVLDGQGDAVEVLRALDAVDGHGAPWFPFLRGPKISVVWVRMMAAPGGAQIRNIEALPVGMDVHVARATVRLGIVRDGLASGCKGNRPIQDAWRAGAHAALGPEAIRGTSAALDPALWFFGKWGCSECE